MSLPSGGGGSTIVPVRQLVRWGWLILALPSLGCRSPVAGADAQVHAGDDARPAAIWTPSGTVDPRKLETQVEDTLRKEHEKTLDPKLE
jgi:hypothetical protein